MKNILKNKVKRDILFLIISGIALILSFANVKLFNLDLAWISIIFCGIPIIKDAIIGLVTEFDIKADVLVSMALIASLIIGETFAAGEVAFIMQIGAFLEEFTVRKSRKGIEKLVHLTPTLARVIINNEEKTINAKDVKVNDILRVNPGETIPVDGIIIKGKTSVDNSVMSGESIPLDLSEGDSVCSGAVNQFGSFEMKATKVGEDSSIQRMVKLVQSADASKAKIVGIADKWATYIVVAAFISALLTWIITGEIIRAVTILVVFCPCALVLATPTAIVAAIGNVSKNGILVKEGDALERLSSISKIAFDKTGTLTYGKPKVEEVVSLIDNIKNKNVGICFDSGHYHVHFNDELDFPKFKDRIFAVHLHDNDKSDDLHLIPFDGTLNWSNVVKNLKECNYSGPITLELCYRYEYLKMGINEFYKKGYEVGNKLKEMFEMDEVIL